MKYVKSNSYLFGIMMINQGQLLDSVGICLKLWGPPVIYNQKCENPENWKDEIWNTDFKDKIVRMWI